jgi:hypothetical protein
MVAKKKRFVYRNYMQRYNFFSLTEINRGLDVRQVLQLVATVPLPA